MFELKIIEKNGQQVMSSVDLAKLCLGESKYAHKDFLRKASKVLGSSHVGKFSYISKDTYGRDQTILLLPEREACLMAMSYSYELQAKVYDRWKLLEEENNRPTVPQNYLEALQHLVEREKELIVARPKAEYHDKVLDTTSCMTTSVIAKDLGMSATKLNRILADLKVQYKRGRQWFLFSVYQDRGYVDTATYHDGNDHTYHSTVWTEKGRQFIINQLKKADLI